MPEANDWAEVKKKIKTIFKWLAFIFLDTVFLTGWVALQWFVSNRVVNNLQLSGIDEYSLLVFQYLFSFATLLPVVAYVFIDASTIIFQTMTIVRQQFLLFRQALKENDTLSADKVTNDQNRNPKKQESGDQS